MTIREIGETNETKRRRLLRLSALWVGGSILLVLSSFLNWGLLLAAALISAIEILGRKEPLLIRLDETRLSIKQGNASLWGAAYEELAAVALAEESTRFGMTVAAKRVIFSKQDGDLFAVAYDAFHETELLALIGALRQRI